MFGCAADSQIWPGGSAPRKLSSGNSKCEISEDKIFFLPYYNISNASGKTVRYTRSWKECSPKTVGAFSGVGYFFGRDLYKKQNIPIGLISSNVGGTAIELWISRKALAKDPGSQAVIKKFEKQCADPKNKEKLELYLETKNKVTKYRKGIRKFSSNEWKAVSDGKWETVNTAAPKEKGKRDYALLSIRKRSKYLKPGR